MRRGARVDGVRCAFGLTVLPVGRVWVMAHLSAEPETRLTETGRRAPGAVQGRQPAGRVSADDARGAVAPVVIGVTGHRNLVNAERELLARRVRELLMGLRQELPHSPLLILSPLAEGADQLVAEIGLELGARLVAPLPFERKLYVQDFADGAVRERFDALCAKAEVIELPRVSEHSRAEIAHPGPVRDLQYVEAGHFVARHCHLLLALWDGKPSARRGGTAQTVEDYLAGSTTAVTDKVRRTVTPLYGGGDEHLLCHLVCSRAGPDGAPAAPFRPGQVFWRNTDSSSAAGAPMPAAFRTVLARTDAFNADVARYVRNIPAAGGQGRNHLTRTEPSATDAPEAASSPAALFDAADWLAVHFQKRVVLAMRVIYIVAYLMAMAFNAYDNLSHSGNMIYVFLLLFLIGIATSVVAKRGDWHRKFLDYRALAEGLRVQDYWYRAGISLTNDPEFARDSLLQKQDVELGWVRNVMRGAGLSTSAPVVNDASLTAVIDAWVGDENTGQLGYYRQHTEQRERAYQLTERISLLCLLVGIGISVGMAIFLHRLSYDMKNDLIVIMGAFSIFAAVREAYAFRKADRELVRQYRFMGRVFGNARKALDQAQGSDEKRSILRALGEAALAEHVEWAVMHRQRPLEAGKM